MKQLHIALSLPTSIFDVSKSNLVKEADIIHLHWVGDFVDLPSLSKKVNKPIVWTLHDENLFCGIRHYEEPDVTLGPDCNHTLVENLVLLSKNPCHHLSLVVTLTPFLQFRNFSQSNEKNCGEQSRISHVYTEGLFESRTGFGKWL